MSEALVKLKNGIKVPANYKAAGRVRAVGAGSLWHGDPVAVVLTDDGMLAACNPAGIIKGIHLQEIIGVNVADFRGITEERHTLIGPTRVAPQDTWGVEVTYQKPYGPAHRLKILVYYRDIAEQWERVIDHAVEAFHEDLYQEMMIDLQLTYPEED